MAVKIIFLAKYKTSGQITQDEWVSFFVEKLFNEETTLKEIYDWVQSRGKSKGIDVNLTSPEMDEKK